MCGKRVYTLSIISNDDTSVHNWGAVNPTKETTFVFYEEATDIDEYTGRMSVITGVNGDIGLWKI